MFIMVMNGHSSPMLFEFISVPLCHGSSCPIMGGTCKKERINTIDLDVKGQGHNK